MQKWSPGGERSERCICSHETAAVARSSIREIESPRSNNSCLITPSTLLEMLATAGAALVRAKGHRSQVVIRPDSAYKQACLRLIDGSQEAGAPY